MTIICAISDGTRTIIGSDTLAVSTNGDKSYTGPKWVLAGPWAIGIAGPLYYHRVVQAHREDVAGRLNSADEPSWGLAVALAALFKEHECKPRGDDYGALFWGGWFMLADAKRIWTFDSTLSSVQAPTGTLAAEGSGCDFAKGVAFAVKHEPADRQVETAIKAAMEFDNGCGGEVWTHELR
jgi:hypothetical protein